MRDDDPPKCPDCNRPLEKLGMEFDVKLDEDDPRRLISITYGCKPCKYGWTDNMDGRMLERSRTKSRKRA